MREQPDWMRWNPSSAFRDVQRLHDEVGRFLGFGPGGSGPEPGFLTGRSPNDRAVGGWGPSVDLRETETDVIARVDVPGVEPGDLDVEISEDGFSIKGEVKHEVEADEGGYHHSERRYGRFYRAVPFPIAVNDEEAKATYRNGVLEIRAPKAESGRGPRKLQIEDGGQAH